MIWDCLSSVGASELKRFEDGNRQYVLVPTIAGRYRWAVEASARFVAIAALTYRGPKPMGIA
jgi:hypothetical protein